MACENCVDLNSQIGDCPPYANRNDVVEALQNIWNQTCCVGELTEDLDPTDPDQILEAFENAFPDGVTECTCGCLWMVYADSESDIFKQYQNCHGQNHWLNASAWCSECGGNNCIGHLTTVGLDPSNSPVDAAASVIEAFPSGLGCPICETAIIFREDRTLCHSIDCGETWDCSSVDGAGMYANSPASSLIVACTGCTGETPCTSNRVNLLKMFDVSPQGDIGSGAEESHNNFLLDCVMCPNGLRFDFKPSTTGWYNFNMNFGFQGMYQIGSVGCPECSQNRNNGGVLWLMDESNAVVFQKNIGVIANGSKTNVEIPIDIIVYLESTKEYHMTVRHNKMDEDCCECGTPTYDVRGSAAIRNFKLVFIEP